MTKAAPETYRLLDGQAASLADLSGREREFLADLRKMVRQGVSYFDVYRAAVGPGSVALGGQSRVDRRMAESALYMVARDLATRAGIEQGLILAPEHEALRPGVSTDGSMISVAQAAGLIGISRAAVYKAIERDLLRVRRIGNVTIVERASAAAYRDRRTSGRRHVRTESRPRVRAAGRAAAPVRSGT